MAKYTTLENGKLVTKEITGDFTQNYLRLLTGFQRTVSGSGGTGGSTGGTASWGDFNWGQDGVNYGGDIPSTVTPPEPTEPPPPPQVLVNRITEYSLDGWAYDASMGRKYDTLGRVEIPVESGTIQSATTVTATLKSNYVTLQDPNQNVIKIRRFDGSPVVTKIDVTNALTIYPKDDPRSPVSGYYTFTIGFKPQSGIYTQLSTPQSFVLECAYEVQNPISGETVLFPFSLAILMYRSGGGNTTQPTTGVDYI